MARFAVRKKGVLRVFGPDFWRFHRLVMHEHLSETAGHDMPVETLFLWK